MNPLNDNYGTPYNSHTYYQASGPTQVITRRIENSSEDDKKSEICLPPELEESEMAFLIHDE